ncbi:MAG: MerR family transcriptional regulator [Planctomycetes bacterium]|nr:MerR family transcriptional regulator [Planctomycetota bacterium]
MKQPDARMDLAELSRSTQVPGRQIRELIRRGVLPRPSSSGRGATYGIEHLDRLRVWKLLREKSPAGTTNDQIQAVLAQLTPEILHGIAEGSIPFELVDDGKREVTIAASITSPPAQGSTARWQPAPGRNEAALAYLSAIETAARPSAPARVAIPAGGRRARIDVDLDAAGRSNAALALERLRRLLAQFAGSIPRGERVKTERSEVWHRVRIGRDLEISARGPLTPDEIQLLETAGGLLHQALR